jgi:hypothetical protein
MTAENELDVLVPESFEVRLSDGTYVEIQELKTIQLLRLLKIVTRGGGSMFLELDIDFGDDPETFGGKLVALVLMSVPEAEDETLAFLRAMVRPVGLIEGRSLSKDDQARNDALWASVGTALVNPPIEDTIDIVEAIVRRVAPDVQSLGKRLRHLWATLNPGKKTGAKPEHRATSQESLPSPDPNFWGGSPERSTWSQPSTGGPMDTSGI